MSSSIRPRPLRLAIIECDSLETQTRKVYKNLTGLFTSLFTTADGNILSPYLGCQVCIQGYHVLDKPYHYPSLDDIDAILITGSRYTAFDDEPWIQALVGYTKRAIDTNGRVKVAGICFGHQIIGRVLGAKVGKSVKGWELSVTEVNLTTEGKLFFQVDKLRIHQMHRDIVFDLPRGAVSLAFNTFCENQIMYLPGCYIAIQGHPEFTSSIASELLLNGRLAGTFLNDEYEDGQSRATMPHDGISIARSILRFMREG